MSHSALLIIDVQQSFQHRPFWQEDDLPAFQQALTRLIAGCQQQGCRWSTCSMSRLRGRSLWRLAT